MELTGNKGRGGARPGAGRKPTIKQYSDDFRKKFMKALRRKERETGRSVYDEFLEALYDRNGHPAARVALFKIWADVFVVRESHQVVERRDTGPQICLPAIMEVPPEYREKDKDLH